MPPAAPYDELPYESRPVPGTCPERLARAARLFGGPRPPARAFRALELGCGDGTNLSALAFYRPESSFLGIDSSARAVAAARAAREELGLANLRFEQADLSEPAAAPPGPFDYAIAHGVYSWIDARARDGLLALVRERLAPGGLLYLSYNVRGGWIVRGLVRDLLRIATAERAGLRERAARARAVALELLPAVAESDHAFHRLLAGELERAAEAESGYLAHEYLAADNVAFDHIEVVARLAEHGLAYLCDALHDAPEGRIPPALRGTLESLGLEGGALEQAADLVGHRRFRASVFCRAEAREAANGADAEDGASGAPAVRRSGGRPHRLALFEARRRAVLTRPDHTPFPLDEDERAQVLRLGAGGAEDGTDLLARLGEAGLLAP